MAHAYTPGLEVSKNSTLTKVRELPLLGRELVKIGDRVKAQTPVLSADLPGELIVVRLADAMGVETADAMKGLRVKVGDTVSRDQLLAEIKTFFGLFTSQACSPVGGVVEFVVDATAHVGIRLPPSPLSVNAYVEGIVTEIQKGRSVTVTTQGGIIQGVFGVGGERQGTLVPLSVSETETVSPAHLENLPVRDGILVGGASFSAAALEFAKRQGAAAVVTGSVTGSALEVFVGEPIGESITGDEEVPFTFIICEGFGNIPLSRRITELARQFAGRAASVNGATQVRAGAMRPEVIIPTGIPESSKGTGPLTVDRSLEVGSQIRFIRVPYFGQLATVTALPAEPTQIETGAHVRVLRAKLENGKEVTVPRANIEIL